jgi:hypothetical protein
MFAPSLLLALALSQGAPRPDQAGVISDFKACHEQTIRILKDVVLPAHVTTAWLKLQAKEHDFGSIVGRQVLANADKSDKDLYWSRFDEEKSRFNQAVLLEYQRLAKGKDDFGIIFEVFPIKQLNEDFKDQTRGRFRLIEFALDHYRFISSDNNYPNALKDLATKKLPGGRPYLTEKELEDPWGRPMQYDRAGPMNKGRKPDIWSLGPLHNKEKTQPIGNWAEEKVNR